MDDLTITRLCAEAMELPFVEQSGEINGYSKVDNMLYSYYHYNPLHDDAQAMALIRRFRIDLECVNDSDEIYWSAYIMESGQVVYSFVDPNINRAICLAVATMQGAKGG